MYIYKWFCISVAACLYQIKEQFGLKYMFWGNNEKKISVKISTNIFYSCQTMNTKNAFEIILDFFKFFSCKNTNICSFD